MPETPEPTIQPTTPPSDERRRSHPPQKRGPLSGPPSRPLSGPPLWGRRVAQVFYWSLTIFVCVAGTRSILGAVFFSPPPLIDMHELSCEEGADRLLSQLLEEEQSWHATEPTSVGAARTDFWRPWDDRFRDVSAKCTSESQQEAYAALAKLRYAIAAEIARESPRRDALLASVRTALSAMRSRTSADSSH